MADICRFVYLSNLAPNCNPEAVTDILREARVRNNELSVTGILVFDGAHFFQYIEGDAAAIQKVVELIRKDVRHCDISVLAEGPVPGPRRFSQWSMGYALAEEDALLRLTDLRSPILDDEVVRLIPTFDLQP